MRSAIPIQWAARASDCGAIDESREPVTLGMPFPRGTCPTVDSLALATVTGDRLPLQARALDTWSDGSIRWALLDFQIGADERRVGGVELRICESAASCAPGSLTVVEHAHTINV